MRDLGDTLGSILFGVLVLVVFLGGGAALGYFLLPLFFGRDLLVPLTLGGVLLGILALRLFFLWMEAAAPIVPLSPWQGSYESQERYYRARQKEQFDGMGAAFYGVVAFFILLLLVGWACRSLNLEPKSVWGVAGILAGFGLSLYVTRALNKADSSAIRSGYEPKDILEILKGKGVLSPDEARSIENALSSGKITALSPRLQQIAIALERMCDRSRAQPESQSLTSAFVSVMLSDFGKVEKFLWHYLIVWFILAVLSYFGLAVMYKFASESSPLWYVYLSWGLAFVAGIFLSMLTFPLCADEEGKWEYFLVWIGGLYFAGLLAYSASESASAIGGLTGLVLAGVTVIYRLWKGWQKSQAEEAARQLEAEIREREERREAEERRRAEAAAKLLERQASGETSRSRYVYADPSDTLVKVGNRPVVVRCETEYSGSDMGFSKTEWSIKTIVDRNGRRLKPVFKRQWTEIAPGIATRNPGYHRRYYRSEEVCKQAIRISREACPVRVLFYMRDYYEDYEDHENYQGSNRENWCLFEAE